MRGGEYLDAARLAALWDGLAKAFEAERRALRSYRRRRRDLPARRRTIRAAVPAPQRARYRPTTPSSQAIRSRVTSSRLISFSTS